MYIKETIKEISPIKTLSKLYNICKKLGLYDNNRLKGIECKNIFGIYRSCLIADYTDILEINLIIIQYGKGYTYEQCMCSMYMEFIERLVNLKNKNVKFISYETGKILKFNKYQQLNIRRFSNGLSSGNSLDETLIGGIYEVLERYAQKCFLNKNNNIDIKLININSLRQNYKKELEIFKNIYSHKDISLIKLYEIKFKGTFIYTYLCYSETKEGFCFLGAGTHHSQRIAIIRAVTENVQVFGGFLKAQLIYRENILFGLGCSSCSFSKYISNKIKEKFKNGNFKEEKIIKLEKEFNSFESLKKNIEKDLKKMNLLDGLFYSKIFNYYNSIYVLFIKIIGCGEIWYIKNNTKRFLGKNIEQKGIYYNDNIEGLEYLYNKKYLSFIQNDSELIPLLEEDYNKMLLELGDIELIKDLGFNTNTVKKVKEKRYYDKRDPDSYLYYYKVLTKEEKELKDYLYLYISYCRIGCSDYGEKYIKLYLGDIFNKNDKKYKDFDFIYFGYNNKNGNLI